MSLRIKKNLVAIRDVDQTPRALLRQAASIARAAKASVELFHAIEDPLVVGFTPGLTPEQERERINSYYRNRLKRLEKAAVLKDVKVSSSAAWDYPAHEAIIRRALSMGADLVIAATEPRRRGARFFLRNTDWELIRHCPMPLLLVKSTRQKARPVVIAAVDPFHANAKPADLDARLLDAGGSIAQLLGGELHVFHAYLPLAAMTAAAMSQVPAWLPPGVEKEHTAQVKRALDSLAAKAGVPPARRHLSMGNVRSELSAIVRRTKASLVVMGAVSRRGLQRLFIGSTAEHALDELPCNVLIIKPRNFKLTISKRPARVEPLVT